MSKKVFTVEPLHSATPTYYDVDPDSVPSSKVLNYNLSVGSAEGAVFFGELQVYGNLLVHGEARVELGSVLLNNLPPTLNYDVSYYGPVSPLGVCDVTSEVTVL